MVQLYARSGGETLVNTTTPGWQSNAKITRLSSGGFVVAWSDSSGIGGDPDGYGIKAQLYNAAGAKVGGEFLVNTATAGSQTVDSIAATASGGFVAVYQTENEALRAQIFDSSGNKVGSELFVTVPVPNPGVLNSNATVTVLTNGVMIVTWDRFDPYGGPNYGEHVYARAFNAATGASLGNEFRLDTGVEPKYNVSVAALASGGWVATWTTNTEGDFNVTGQVFAANGVKVGGEFAVNTTTAGSQGSAVVLALPAGGFVVAFLDHDANPGDGSYFGIRAQIFNDSGVKVGSDFPVNTVTDGDQYSISMDDLPGGGFVISWTDGSLSLGDDQGTSVMAQVFNSAGAKVGSQFLVNTTTARDQSNPAVLGLDSGGFAVAWQNRLGDELSMDVDIQLQLFAPTAGAATDIALSPASVSETSIGNFAVATFSDNGGVNSAKTYTLLADSTGGGFRIEGNRLVVADNRKLDYETAPNASLTVRVTDANGNSFDEAVSVAIADAAIEERYSAGQEFTVASTTAAGQTIAATAALAGGGFVMTWTDNSTGDANPDNHINVKGQLYDATGAKVGDAFVVNTVVQSWQAAPAAAGLASGGFVVVWEDASHIGGDLEWAALKGQRFNSSGAKVGSEFLVNTATEGSQYDASVAKLASGGFVVTWTSDATHTPVISAQLFDSNGAKVGGEFAVNPNTDFGQTALHSSVVALADGSFVVVWTSQLQVRAQIIGADGIKIGSDFAVAGDGYGQDYASVGALSSGGFVVSWHDENHQHGDTNGKGVKAQVFDSAGVKVGTSFLVNTKTDGSQTSPTVGGLPWGGFVISWLDSAMFSDNTSAKGVRSQIFDSTGAKVGVEIVIDTGPDSDKALPISTVLASGGFVVGWTEAYLDENSAAQTRFEGRIISRAAADNSGDDILTGDAAANLLDGGAGNDQIHGNGGNDDLRGGTGIDRLYVSGTGIVAADGGADFDYLIVNYGDATTAITMDNPNVDPQGGLTGTIGDGGTRRVDYGSVNILQITTGSGNDTVHGGQSGSTASLGGGDDRFYGSFDPGPNETADGGLGVDGVSAGLGLATSSIVWNLQTNSFSSPIGTYTNFEYFLGIVTGSANDTIVTTSANLNDTFSMGSGDDVATVINGQDHASGEFGNDLLIIDYSASTNAIVTTGGAAGITLGSDSSGVSGQIGDGGSRRVNFFNIDRFDVRTGSGNDNIVLGTGSLVSNDIVNLGGGDDFADLGRGTDQGNGGTGTDGLAADFSLAVGAIGINLLSNIWSGPAGTNFTAFEYLGTASSRFLTGSGNDSIVTGSGALADFVSLGAGTDSATVHNGQDDVNGQAGSDLLIIDYSAATASVTTTGGAGGIALGTDGAGLKGQVGDGGTRRIDFDNIERFDVRTGSGNDNIVLGTGSLATSDIVNLGGGNDFADFGRGIDQGNGGSGVDGLAADFTLAGNIAIDLVLNSWSGPAGTSFTNFEYLGSAASRFLTGGGNDVAVTTSANLADHVSLGAGSDTATVRNGLDNVNGQTGTDLLVIDYSAATGAVTTTGGPGGIALGTDNSGLRGQIGDGGTRRIDFDNIERFDVRTGAGSDNITLGTGNLATSDVVSLGGGDDAVDFGRGLDVGDGGAGVDSLAADISLAGVAISINLVANSFSGPAGISFVNFEYFGGTGLQTGQGADTIVTALINRNDVVALGQGNDSVTLYNGQDSVFGGLLNAGAADSGLDTLILDYGAATNAVHNVGAIQSNGAGAFGQIGDDSTRLATFQAIDRFLVTTGSGNDIVATAGGHDEVRTGTGTDTIATGGGDDLLDGGAGADSMTGGTGNDLYVVDDGSDSLTENAGEGNDTVRTSLAVFSLAGLAHVENLTGTSAAGQTLTGNAASNLVNAGGGNDQLHLWAGGGNDTVNAGAGMDNIFFGATLTAADVVNGGAGVDTLVVQGPYGSLTLSANVTQIENVSILGGNNTNFGEPGTNRYDYVLTTNDANFAAGVQARINGAALLEGEDFTFDGSAETDASYVVYGGKGKDTLLGGLGNDIFFYAEERFASGDTVNGGAGYDGMFLRGNYTIDFNAPGYTGLFTNIENLTLTSATDERYARGGGTEFDYNLVLSDAIVNAGQELTVSGALLMASETMILDASQETNGRVRLFGGKAADTLKGGAVADLLHGNLGADILSGGGGADAFRYQAVTESYSVARDHIVDFTPGTDKIELDKIDAKSNVAGDQAFTWIGSGAFSNTAGELRAFQSGGQWIVQGDINGDGFADLIIALTLQGPTPLGAGDFLL